MRWWILDRGPLDKNGNSIHFHELVYWIRLWENSGFQVKHWGIVRSVFSVLVSAAPLVRPSSPEKWIPVGVGIGIGVD